MTVQTWANMTDNIITYYTHFPILSYNVLEIEDTILIIANLYPVFLCQYFLAKKLYDTLE